MRLDLWAGMIIDWPVSRILEIPSITSSALPSIIWAYVSKGVVFSANPSPLSNDIILIFPVVFFIIVLLTTELGTYSIISTVICAFDFSISELSILFDFSRLILMNCMTKSRDTYWVVSEYSRPSVYMESGPGKYIKIWQVCTVVITMIVIVPWWIYKDESQWTC